MGLALRRIYGVYAMTMFALVVFVLFGPVLIALPTLALRREVGRLCVRCFLWSCFVPLSRRGLEHLPAGVCVAACNHSSYLDGIVLTAALPRRFTFLVQHGARDWFYVGLILRRMGVVFVDRGSARAAAVVTRELIARLQAGESVAIFPEGTFRAKPELRTFQSGAFLIASRAGVPVVPSVLSGTRQLFGEGQRLPRHSRLRFECFAPIAPLGADRQAATDLGNAVRAVMLAHCGEADGAAAVVTTASL